MAAQKVKTRIQNKHDVEANWLQAVNFIPMAGEVIVYDQDSNYSSPRIKIGDGQTTINNLPFVSGLLFEQEGTDSIPFVALAHLSDGSEVEY